MLVEHDGAVIVLDDVVAVEPVAVLVEIVRALGALISLHREDRLTNFLRLETPGTADRAREDVESIVTSGREDVRG